MAKYSPMYLVLCMYNTFKYFKNNYWMKNYLDSYKKHAVFVWILKVKYKKITAMKLKPKSKTKCIKTTEDF